MAGPLERRIGCPTNIAGDFLSFLASIEVPDMRVDECRQAFTGHGQFLHLLDVGGAGAFVGVKVDMNVSELDFYEIVTNFVSRYT